MSIQDTGSVPTVEPAPPHLHMADAAISAHALRRRFKATIAVDGIDLRVERGTIFGLLGPNGAGKTTIIRMLTGQIVPTSGTATVGGFDVVRDREQLKPLIGVVFEDQNLYDRLSGRQNLEFARWLYAIPKRRIDEVLDLVELRDRARDPVQAYSNGMRQRLMIARALLHEPRILFLDEPSRGLDPIAARQIRQTIQHLRDTGMTILLTTHLMDEADHLCQRVAFIVAGTIVANDTPRALKLAHSTPVVEVTMADEEDGLREVTLNLRDAGDQQRLATWIAADAVRSMHTREATLEEVFIATAGVRPA